MPKKKGGSTSTLIIRYGARAGEVAAVAARELAEGLAKMLGGGASAASDPALDARTILVSSGAEAPVGPNKMSDDGFQISRPGRDSIAITSGNERGLLHGAYDLMERVGARFVAGAPANFPEASRDALAKLKPYAVTPAFKRRAMASDIMTWNYTHADRLAQHLRFDREFIPWMARRGINGFEYIRHAHDTKQRIDELTALYIAYGVGVEYGGHVLQILMPREQFALHPEYFPAGKNGERSAKGNLCASNPDALRMVTDGALRYARDCPENELLHIWGADVREGAWCRCAQCKKLSPHLQYMTIVNAVGAALASAGSTPVAYLAYHDTLDPDRKLRPLPNVHFEWAPRERCYIHAIDDGDCAINPRYLESLKRYLEIFDGRGHVFEYYADAILFGGIGFATPTTIARDLRAYKGLGIDSICNLTFGAYSVLAYPLNLEAFVRGTRSSKFSASGLIAECAANRHPKAADAMGKAYRHVERAASMVLDYADVMCPYEMTTEHAAAKKPLIEKAFAQFEHAVKLANATHEKYGDALAGAEEELWSYSFEVLSGIGDYIRAHQEGGIVKHTLGQGAIAQIAGALEHIHNIEADRKGTWGAYDLEWLREMWLDGLRKNLGAFQIKMGKLL